ncbi:MAG: hypothetical protein ACI85Q_001941 [Salibacteraceae bacterium]|jgi:hypothetical protein
MGICSKLFSKSNIIIGIGIIAFAISPKLSFSQSEEDILNSIGSELDDESSKKKEAARVEKEYKVLKSKADGAYAKKLYDKAKEYYDQMVKLKPGSDYAKGRITLMNQKIAQAKAVETEKKYQSLIKQADALLASEKWTEATSKYNAALSISPDESYPKSQIAQVAALKTQAAADAKAAVTQKKYEETLASAERALSAKNWDVAKQKFKEAAGIKPGESYPREKAAMIEKLKAEAIAKAKKVKLDKEYTAELAKADQLLSTKNFDGAIASYQVAKTLKPSEAYPTQQIAKANARIKIDADKKLKAEQLETSYQKQKKIGEEAISQKNWLAAIEALTTASSLKPGNTDITNLLNQAKSGKRAADELALKEKANEEARVKTQKQYESVMAKGAAALTDKNWEEARSAFSSAKKLKPEELGPANQLTKIDQLVAEEKVAQADADAKKLALEKAEQERLAEEASLAAEKKEAEFAKIAEAKRVAEAAALAAEIAEKARQVEEAKLAADKKAAAEVKLAKEAAVAAAKAEEKESARLKAELAEKQRVEQEAKLAAENAVKEKKRRALETAAAASLAAESKANEEAQQKEKERIAAEKAIEEAKRVALEKEQLAVAAELAAVQAKEKKKARLEADLAEKQRIEQEEQLAADQMAKEKARLAMEASAAASLLAELKAKDVAQQKEIDRIDAQNVRAEAERLAEEQKLAQAEKKEERAQLAAQNKVGFDKAVTDYKTALKNSDWDLALRAVNSAETFMPDNAQVAKMQGELSSMQNAEKTALNAEKEIAAKALVLDKKYQAAVSSGDVALAKLDFTTAKAAYKTAVRIKSSEDYPKNQLDVIKGMEVAANAKALAVQQKLDKEYSTFMASGEQAMKQQKWALAKGDFKNALKIKPSSTGPNERIQAIEKLELKEKELASRVAELDEDYAERMKNGQISLENEKYADAKRFFFGASKLKPSQELPKEKLKEVETLWAAQLEIEKKIAAAQKTEKLEANYTGFISSGDQALQNKMWDEAISSYQGAIKLKPEEVYPKQKLMEVKNAKSDAIDRAENQRLEMEAEAIAAERERLKMAAEADAKAVLETNFLTAMSKGNSAMSQDKFGDAVKGYSAALKLKPENEEAVTKLQTAKNKFDVAEADRKVVEVKRRKVAAIQLAKRKEVARIQREAYLEKLNKNSSAELAKNYPDGITEEIETENELVLTKSIIVENNTGRYLIRFDYPWGEHFYYLDGKKIREDAYNWNVRKYKF